MCLPFRYFRIQKFRFSLVVDLCCGRIGFCEQVSGSARVPAVYLSSEFCSLPRITQLVESISCALLTSFAVRSPPPQLPSF